MATITYACLAFFTLLTLYLLNNWLPTLIHAMGFPINQAAWATAAFQLGGILGAVTLGLLADRLESIRVVVTAYLAAAAIIVWMRVLDRVDAMAARRRESLIATLVRTE